MADGKYYGKSLPSPVDPETTICFKITVPNALQYKAALLGQLNFLGLWFAWRHQNDGIIPADNEIAAQLWTDAVAGSSFEECMDFCEQMIACLTTDGDVQDALAELIRTNPAIGAALNDYVITHPNGTTYPRDQELPSDVSGSSFLSGNPDCDPDILYAQCIGTIETAIQLTTDFLNQWQVYDASGKVAAAIIQAIPGVGIVADASGVEGVIEYANAIADSIQTNFNGDNTLDYREQLACAFFCAAKDDCNLSIDDCLTILQDRLSGELTFGNVAELFLSLLDANITGINVADLYLCAFFGLVKLGNWLLPVSWGIDIFAITVSTFDTPNNDWEELCTDCPPEPVDTCVDFTTGKHDWDILSGIGTYVAGTGFQAGNFGGNYLYTVRGYDATLTGTVTKVTFTFSAPVTKITFQPDSPGQYMIYSGTAVTDVVFDATTFPGEWHDYAYALHQVQTSLDGVLPSDVVLTGICFDITP